MHSTDFEALVQLTHRFFYLLDTSDYDALLALMTEDSTWLRQGKSLRTHAVIREALEERPKTQRTLHVISNAFLEAADAGEAKLVAYMTAYRHDDGRPASGPAKIDGPFRMSIVRTRFRRDGGGWLIAEQSVVPEFEFRGAA